MKIFALLLALAFVASMPAAGLCQDAPADKRLCVLMGSLKDPDPMVRQASARGLGEAVDKAAVPALSGLVAGDPDEGVRLAAMGALLMIGDRSALPAYEGALRDESEDVRQSAAEALSGLWDREAHSALINALRTDPSAKVRRNVALALGNPGVLGRYSAHSWDSEGETEPALIQALKSDKSYEVRATAAEVLGKFQRAGGLDVLLDALNKDESAAVRAAAAESLGMLGKAQAVGPLLDVVSFEKDESVLASALRALKNFQDPRLGDAAVAALKSSSTKVRWQAIDLVEGVRPQEAIAPLKKIAGDENETDGVRFKAHEALQMMGAE